MCAIASAYEDNLSIDNNVALMMMYRILKICIINVIVYYYINDKLYTINDS